MTELFDQYATDYDAALAEGISLSGEDKHFFARGRLTRVREWLAALGHVPSRILDFGCGTGTSSSLFLELLKADAVVGIDVSSVSIAQAKAANRDARVRFQSSVDYRPDASFDLAFCNGVFHHILPPERLDTVRTIHASLRPGALFALWENNPWNPGTRLVMKRIPFDRDAVMLSAREAEKLLRKGGFDVLRREFWFVFPKPLRYLRRLEPKLANLPLGAQYGVLCRRPLPPVI